MIKTFILASALLSSPLLAAESPSEIETLKKIKQHMATYYDQHKGMESKRSVVVEERDPEENTILLTKNIERQVKVFINKNRETETLSCSIDGKSVDIDDCEDMGSKEPYHPLFGKKSSKFYLYDLKPQNDGTWLLKISPKDNTSRHFMGTLSFDKNLRLTKQEGTIADIPFPLKSLALNIKYKPFGDLDLIDEGRYDILLKIPLVLHKKMTVKFKASEQKVL